MRATINTEIIAKPRHQILIQIVAHFSSRLSRYNTLRPCVTFRKITNGFRTEWGTRLYADIRSVIETARRREIGDLEAIRLTIAGTPLPAPAS